jgi:hypothetical protein
MRTTRLALLLCSLLVAGAVRQVAAQNYTLTISANSPYGTVLGQAQYASGYSINCGHGESKCSGSYPAGTTVFLSSVANIVGGEWSRWAGACNGRGSTCEVVMDKNKTVDPKFNEWGAYTLKIEYPGDRARVDAPAVAGSVMISCGGYRHGNSTAGGNYCTAKRTKTLELVLTALISDGYVFKGWTGACGSQGNPCRIRPDADLVDISIQVGVKPPPVAVPHVTITAPTYGGTISVAGKTCPGDCSFASTAGAKLVFTANPSAGYTVQNWEGACAGQANPCTLTMDASDKKIAVRFWQH